MLTEDAINMGAVTARIRALAHDTPLCILVVDDDELERILIGDRLETRGFEVVHATDGQEALTLLDKQFFPVLLIDWQMPVMDGIELTKRLRARGMTDTYVIMLTSRDTSFDYERGYAAGVDDYLTKKIREVELLARIQAGFSTFSLRCALKKARAAPAATTMNPPRKTPNRVVDKDPDGTVQTARLAIAITPKVLLVDDDELLIEQLTAVIATAGFEVSTAASGAAALAALQMDFAPIVILDRNMPSMNGLELCTLIRQQTWPGYVYLMLLTIQDSEDDILAGLDAGADDYLSKRASPAQLVARLRTARRILSLEHSLKDLLEERQRMAMTDALTGVHNRRYFMRHLGSELKRMRRFGGELSLLALDIDHFKKVNDCYGHRAGDQVLTKFVQRIQKCLPREYDWCARVGGEEFAVVLPQTTLTGARIVAEKLRGAIAADPFATEAGTLSVTVSIGISGLEALVDRDRASVEMLLADADKYLYQSKASGRNRVTIPEPHLAH